MLTGEARRRLLTLLTVEGWSRARSLKPLLPEAVLRPRSGERSLLLLEVGAVGVSGINHCSHFSSHVRSPMLFAFSPQLSVVQAARCVTSLSPPRQAASGEGIPEHAWNRTNVLLLIVLTLDHCL